MGKFFFGIVKLIVAIAVIVIGLNVYVIKGAEDGIIASDTGIGGPAAAEVEALKRIDPECILVLGASVRPDGTPSQMLEDRLETGVALYKSGVAPKLLLSGDDGQVHYNEVKAMKEYALNAGVPAEDIFLDHAGFSTYESIYRAAYIFQIERVVVVTQEYHLYRSLYGCERMGITALGVSSNQDSYGGQETRELREILARDKDCIKWIFKPEPTFLGDPIPISGSGLSTH